jgi:hypothetical protein
MVTLTLTADNMNAFMGKIPDGPKRAATLTSILDKGRWVILQGAMRRIKSRTGNLARSGSTDFDPSQMVAHIKFMATDPQGQGYAAYPDQGVEPHVIEPRLAAAMRFVDPAYAIQSGQIQGFTGYVRRTGAAVSGADALYIYRQYVEHPGQVAQHFLAGGLDDAMPAFKAIMDKAAATMLGAAGG